MTNKRKATHSFTAYQCRICPKYRTDNLLVKSGEKWESYRFSSTS